MQILIGVAVTHWRADFEKGRRAAQTGGNPLRASFYDKIKEHEPYQNDPKTISGPLGAYIIACWAGHHLPPDLFRYFLRLAARGDPLLMGSLIRVTNELGDLRPEIAMPKGAPKARPRPKLETAETRQARERWRKTQLFAI
ncbi:hypothetical protein [Pseudoponticoccus marisrubri]|uniref:hypothetical protein n=1 Tax=Pseudoponticoccus marisrubri TaxID=1685382 RepID=UPI0012FDF3FE|nr:hypothetical protein [Pseudoponticoccus marisrubri]